MHAAAVSSLRLISMQNPFRYLNALLVVAALALVAACNDGPVEPVGNEEPTSLGLLVGTPDPVEPGEQRTGSSTPSPEPTPTREPVLVSLDWLAGDVAVPGLDGPIAAPVLDAGLQSAVAGALAGHSGDVSVVVHNLADGRYTASNETRTWYAASTFKASVLLEAYRQRDSGELDFAKLVTLEEKYAENDLGTLEYLEIKPNDQVSVQDAIKGMIVVSDTSLALLMVEQVNSNRIDATLREIGTTVMTMNNSELPTTAIDLAQLMTAIASGYGVSAASRDEMLSLLSQEWFTEGIIAGVPAGTSLAHKSGNFTGATHDAAIVWGPDGPYSIVVMTDGSGGWSPIAAVSAAVWQYFEATP